MGKSITLFILFFGAFTFCHGQFQEQLQQKQSLGGLINNRQGQPQPGLSPGQYAQSQYVGQSQNQGQPKRQQNKIPQYANAPNPNTLGGYYGENGKKFRPQNQNPNQNQGQRGQGQGLSSVEQEELEESLEEEKPDRLTELMKNSKFNCQGKKDGYYADDSLNCEVFHYCQDGGKHSWLCPNQFAFHQIHLICVPPSSDNICKQSPDYHFVNDYLYKPVNQKNHDAYNATLKYADRFFPDGYNNGGSELLPYDQGGQGQGQGGQGHRQQYEESEEEEVRRPVSQSQQQQRRPVQQQQVFRQPPSQQGYPPQYQNQNQQHRSSSQLHPMQSNRPQHSSPPPSAFFSPESVNIPLTQRRPLPNNFKPSPSFNPLKNNY